MQELLHQLGIDWKLLISQAVNFALVLLILRAFVYKPLLRIMQERRERIEEGLAKAEEADRRLRRVDEAAREKMKDAEKDALQMLRETEEKAKGIEAKLLEEAKKKEAELLKSAEAIVERKAEEARRAMRKDAAEFVKAAIVRTVELSPAAVDEALVKKAVGEIANARESGR